MQGLLDLLLVLSLNGFDECLGGHRAVNQGLEAGDNGAGLHTCGGIVDVVGGVTGFHQAFVGGEDLAEQLVVGARGVTFANRRVAIVNGNLAGFIGLEEVEEGGCSSSFLGHLGLAYLLSALCMRITDVEPVRQIRNTQTKWPIPEEMRET